MERPSRNHIAQPHGDVGIVCIRERRRSGMSERRCTARSFVSTGVCMIKTSLRLSTESRRSCQPHGDAAGVPGARRGPSERRRWIAAPPSPSREFRAEARATLTGKLQCRFHRVARVHHRVPVVGRAPFVRCPSGSSVRGRCSGNPWRSHAGSDQDRSAMVSGTPEGIRIRQRTLLRFPMPSCSHGPMISRCCSRMLASLFGSQIFERTDDVVGKVIVPATDQQHPQSASNRDNRFGFRSPSTSGRSSDARQSVPTVQARATGAWRHAPDGNHRRNRSRCTSS